MGNVVGLIRQLIESHFIGAGKPAEEAGSVAFEQRKAPADLTYEIRDLVITENQIVANIVMTGTPLREFARLQLNAK